MLLERSCKLLQVSASHQTNDQKLSEITKGRRKFLTVKKERETRKKGFPLVVVRAEGCFRLDFSVEEDAGKGVVCGGRRGKQMGEVGAVYGCK